MRKKFYLILVILISIFTIYMVGIWLPSEEESIAANGSAIRNSDELKNEVNNFKIDKEELLGKLSKSDKEELNDILNKISVVDIGKIEGYISQDNQNNKGIKDAARLLQKRLSKEQYKKIEDILAPYVNLDVLNQIK